MDYRGMPLISRKSYRGSGGRIVLGPFDDADDAEKARLSLQQEYYYHGGSARVTEEDGRLIVLCVYGSLGS